jgi:uncharacterized lipoprotein NlpE involved in copper resistance
MRIFFLLCIGVLLLGTIGCSEQPSTDSTLTNAVAEVSVEVESAPGAQAMRGLFTYMADAAIFEDCVSGRRYPVAMEADYISVERAYLEARSEPGAPLLVVIRAGIERRPPMEGDGEIDVIVVERFEAAFPGGHCSGE